MLSSTIYPSPSYQVRNTIFTIILTKGIELVFAANTDFQISLKPNVVDFEYLKLWAWNIKGLQSSRCKDIIIRKFEFEAKTQFLWSFPYVCIEVVKLFSCSVFRLISSNQSSRHFWPSFKSSAIPLCAWYIYILKGIWEGVPQGSILCPDLNHWTNSSQD